MAGSALGDEPVIDSRISFVDMILQFVTYKVHISLYMPMVRHIICHGDGSMSFDGLLRVLIYDSDDLGHRD